MKKVNALLMMMTAIGVMASFSSVVVADGWGNSKAKNQVSIGIRDTRHDLTLTYLNKPDTVMDYYRNNYGEVCVYCHTPHGANSSAGAKGMPLWNRTVNTSLEYKLYDMPTMQMGADQNVTMPGPASLTCLSCHDGVTAIDSIINMPGSGLYNKVLEDAPNNGLLDQWDKQLVSSSHASLGGPEGCVTCHNEGFMPGDFRAFVIGAGSPGALGGVNVDLRNDHPVGVLYPTTFGPGGFREMNGQTPLMSFFDLDADGKADKNEIRIYNSGEGYEVECASCHDPHGVPDSTGATFIPSFLRVENGASALCQACHDK